MRTSSAMENLWLYLQSLPRSNKRWLSERLKEDLAQKEVSKEVDAGKKEILNGIDAGLKEAKLYREGKLELKSLEDALNEI